MASNYPGSADSFDTIAADKKQSDTVGGRTHRAMHNDLGDAIEAVQTELGANPSGGDATVAARLTAIEAGTNLGTNSVGATQLADNAVDTAAIADGAVTPAKLATTGRFVFPTGAANGYGFASGAVHVSGTGAPEGAVTAAPGSTWLQTDSTTDVKGWLRWIKATGTGNTGWIAGPEADTGWRDVSSLLHGDWTPNASAGYVRLRRRGTAVLVAGRLDRVTASGGRGAGSQLTAAALPSGFLPRNNYIPRAQGARCVQDTAYTAIQDPGTPGLFIIYCLGSAGTWAAGDDVHFEMSYDTADAWPTSLPGSAA